MWFPPGCTFKHFWQLLRYLIVTDWTFSLWFFTSGFWICDSINWNMKVLSLGHATYIRYTLHRANSRDLLSYGQQIKVWKKLSCPCFEGVLGFKGNPRAAVIIPVGEDADLMSLLPTDVVASGSWIVLAQIGPGALICGLPDLGSLLGRYNVFIVWFWIQF